VTAEEIETLVEAWSQQTLPFAEWTHQAHLTVALWHVLRYPPEEALDRVRAGIQAYNLSQGVEQTPEGGYHETLTRIWMALVQDFVSRSGPGPIEKLAPALWAACQDQKLALRFYTRERLLSWEARTTFLEPDLLALP
jgi:hypothetical protein